MSKKIASDVRIYYGGYDLGTATTSVSIVLEAKSLDPTAITDTAERALGGLRSDAVTWGGLFDDGTSADAAGSALIATGTSVLSVLLGTGTGNVAYAGTVLNVNVKSVSALADLVKEELGFKPDQAFERGQHFGRGTIASGIWSGTIDNGTATFAGGNWYIQVFNVVTPSTISLDHCSDGTSWVSVGSFPVSGRTSSKVISTGTLNRYTRINQTTAGTFEQVVTLVRQ